MASTSAKPKYAKTQAELARILGVARITVIDWAARGCPKKTALGWNVEKIRKWRAETLQPAIEAKRPKKGDGARLLKAQADERESKAAMAAFQLEVERGKYVPQKDVQERDIARIHALKRAFGGMVRTLPPRLCGLSEREMAVVLKKGFLELQARFARM